MLHKLRIPKATERTKKWMLFLIILGSFITNGLVFKDMSDYTKVLEKISKEQELTITSFQKRLALEKDKSSSLENNLKTEQQNNQAIRTQIDTITSTVGVLEKLKNTDPELLKKYSKVYFLNENYKPKDLFNIDPKYLLQKDKPAQINIAVWPHLQQMLEDSISNGMDIKILSAYRSFEEQTSLKSNYKITYGSGANKFSADQGYSEHQLGTTLDFTTTKDGATLTGFEKTNEYTWLVNNAYRYGFIISYPKENSYYIFEPWHWRYVGINLATRIHNDKTYFYSLEQRDIDGYLINLFD
jgi:D-alanyl-D-alanine carboxypeptidase